MRSGKDAFAYPVSAHVRKHGPAGYRNYQTFKRWLRDEFSYRCIYCLKRERWVVGCTQFAVEHFKPKKRYKAGITDYDNLFYACADCNSCKNAKILSIDPCKTGFGQHVRVRKNGKIRGLTPAGKKLIDICALDQPLITEWRRKQILLFDMLYRLEKRDKSAKELLNWELGYPTNLPDLACLKVPTNHRVAGIAESAFELRRTRRLAQRY